MSQNVLIKNSLNRLTFSGQNFQSEFSDSMSNVLIFDILITLKIKIWQCSSDKRTSIHVSIKELIL